MNDPTLADMVGATIVEVIEATSRWPGPFDDVLIVEKDGQKFKLEAGGDMNMQGHINPPERIT